MERRIPVARAEEPVPLLKSKDPSDVMVAGCIEGLRRGGLAHKADVVCLQVKPPSAPTEPFTE